MTTINKQSALEFLDAFRKGVEGDTIPKFYVVWTRYGENYDEVYNYPLIELIGILETAKHMQLQSYVQETFEGLFGKSAEDIAREIFTDINDRRWGDIDQEQKNGWIDAVRSALHLGKRNA